MTDTTDHGGAMADAHGAREQGPRGHETAQEKHREKEGEKEMLTTVKMETKAAQIAGATRGGRISPATVVPARSRLRVEARRGEMGRGRRRAALPTSYPSARGRRGDRGRGVGGRLGG